MSITLTQSLAQAGIDVAHLENETAVCFFSFKKGNNAASFDRVEAQALIDASDRTEKAALVSISAGNEVVAKSRRQRRARVVSTPVVESVQVSVQVQKPQKPIIREDDHTDYKHSVKDPTKPNLQKLFEANAAADYNGDFDAGIGLHPHTKSADTTIVAHESDDEIDAEPTAQPLIDTLRPDERAAILQRRKELLANSKKARLALMQPENARKAPPRKERRSEVENLKIWFPRKKMDPLHAMVLRSSTV